MGRKKKSKIETPQQEKIRDLFNRLHWTPKAIALCEGISETQVKTIVGYCNPNTIGGSGKKLRKARKVEK